MATFSQSYATMCEFIAEHDRIPASRDKHAGIAIGAWVRRQRHKFQRGQLTPEEMLLLANTPKWKWKVRIGRPMK